MIWYSRMPNLKSTAHSIVLLNLIGQQQKRKFDVTIRFVGGDGFTDAFFMRKVKGMRSHGVNVVGH